MVNSLKLPLKKKPQKSHFKKKKTKKKTDEL